MLSKNSIEIHGLTKRFDANTVVDRLNLEIPKGTIFGLLGPNGAGKSALELSDFSGQLAKTLSSGTRKKTSLAIALLTNPRVLILDEPFEGLDPVISARLKSILLAAAARGITVFLTTHLLETVDRFLTHYGILRAGRLTLHGSIADLASRGVTLQETYLAEFEHLSSEDLAWLG